MIEELIYFLVGDTTNETSSPVYTALNTLAMLAEMEDIPKVRIYRGQAQGISYPYALFYDNGERLPGDRGLGGNAAGNYSEIHVMMVELGAIGRSDIEAKRRAGYLRLAVEAQLERTKQVGRNALTRFDLGGTQSRDTISNWLIDVRNPEVRTSGGGLNANNTTTWTAKSVIRVLVTVNKIRSTI